MHVVAPSLSPAFVPVGILAVHQVVFTLMHLSPCVLATTPVYTLHRSCVHVQEGTPSPVGAHPFGAGTPVEAASVADSVLHNPALMSLALGPQAPVEVVHCTDGPHHDRVQRLHGASQATCKHRAVFGIVYGSTMGFVSYGGFTHVGFPSNTLSD
jgi:hypothetical protein